MPDTVTTTAEKLSAPFDPRIVKWRPGSMTKDKTKAMALAYVDARNVMERLDAAFGFNNWGDSYTVLSTQPAVVECAITALENGAKAITKTDVGYQNGDGDDEPMKSAYSDAFKRAAVKWGIGRELYETPQFWIELDEHKRFVTLPIWDAGKGIWTIPGTSPVRQTRTRAAAKAEPVAEQKVEPEAAVTADQLADGAKRKLVLDAGLAKGLTKEQLGYARAMVTGKATATEMTVGDCDKLLAKLEDAKFIDLLKDVK